MNLFRTYSKKAISAPKNDIVCTNERFVQRQPITLVLKENVFCLSGDEFSIKDINKVEYFICKKSSLNIKKKKVLYDLYEKPILNIKDKIISFTECIKIYEGNGETKKLAKISAQSVFNIRKYIIEFYNSATKRNDYLEMNCDTTSYSCGIFHGKEKEGAPMVAKITKKLDAKTILSSKQNYYCEIAPGVDMAFIVALAICFDEFKNE